MIEMRFITLLLLCFLLLSSGGLQAAEWSLKGSLNQGLSYDDNVFMLSDKQVVNESRGSFQYRILPLITFQHKTNNTDLYANAQYGTQIYTDVEGLDQDIQNYGVGGSYQTQRFEWGFSANYAITPSRNNAVQSSGVFNTNAESTTWTIAPHVSYKIDALNSLILSPSYSETNFSNSNATSTNSGIFNNNFSNSHTTNINLAWQSVWSKNYTSSVSLFYSTFESERSLISSGTGNSNLPSSFDTYGINFTNNYSWSPDLTFDGTIGGRYTETTDGSETNSSLGFLANIGINYTQQYYSTSLQFSRSLIPSNFGQLQEQTNVNYDFHYSVSETISSGFTINYQESTGVNGTDPSTQNNTGTQNARDNLSFQPFITWQVATDWSLAGSYRHRIQEGLISGTNTNQTVNDEASSNLFMLTLNYNWQGIRASK